MCLGREKWVWYPGEREEGGAREAREKRGFAGGRGVGMDREGEG